MSELKPCPFCGGEAMVCHVKRIGDPKFLEFKVECSMCLAAIPVSRRTKDEAIKAWNTRHEPKTPGGAYTLAREERLKQCLNK